MTSISKSQLDPASTSDQNSRAPAPISPSIYDPIQNWQTRILRIHPGDPLTPLKADVLVLDLVVGSGGIIDHDVGYGIKKRIEYTALSYTWGPPTQPMESLLLRSRFLSEPLSDDQFIPIQITNNLFGALKSFRSRLGNSKEYIWIDAVSINQQDVAEKVVQIPLMLDIYRKATSVMVWLGQDDPDCEYGLKMLEQPDLLLSMISEDKGKPENEGKKDRAKMMQSSVAKMIKVYNLPWFTRAWVRQEAYAARTMAIHYGESTTSWARFLMGIIALDQLTDKSKEVYGLEVDKLEGGSLRRLQDFATRPLFSTLMERNQPPRDLLDVLLSTAHFSATLEQDTMFSILGMTGIAPPMEAGNQESLVTISYDRSMSDIYEDITRVVIMKAIQTDSLRLLHAVFQCHITSEYREKGAASWAMKWNESSSRDERLLKDPYLFLAANQQSENSVSFVPLIKYATEFNPFSETVWSSPFNRMGFTTPRQLSMEGIIYGQIHSINHQGSDLKLLLQSLPIEQMNSSSFDPSHIHGKGRYQIATVAAPIIGAFAIVGPFARVGDFIFGYSDRVLPLVVRSISGSKLLYPDFEMGHISFSDGTMIKEISTAYNNVTEDSGDEFTFHGPILLPHRTDYTETQFKWLMRQTIHLV
jgi:hypothetical protein